MHALAKFRQYLVGECFVVRTDHNNLRYLLDQRGLNERLQKWVSKVQAYDFEIEYVKDKKSVVSDALSRRLATFSMTEMSVEYKSILLVEYSKNTFSCELMEGIIQDDRYRVVDDIIYYKDMIYLFLESTLKNKIMRAVHDAPLAGHLGYLNIYMRVRERFS
jgi:hypothetical protein